MFSKFRNSFRRMESVIPNPNICFRSKAIELSNQTKTGIGTLLTIVILFLECCLKVVELMEQPGRSSSLTF